MQDLVVVIMQNGKAVSAYHNISQMRVVVVDADTKEQQELTTSMCIVDVPNEQAWVDTLAHLHRERSDG